jgi:hypothetical protein
VNYAWILRNGLGWGLGLWLIGYVLGIALFAIIPTSIIGWVIMPIGTLITIWVLITRVKAATLSAYALLSVLWCLIAVVFDYVFIVRAFAPGDGYYKPDVYAYYALTFLLPLAVGLSKHTARRSPPSKATSS